LSPRLLLNCALTGFILLSQSGCQLFARKAKSTSAPSSLTASPPKAPPRLEIDGKKLSEEKMRALLFETPIAKLRTKKPVLVEGREIPPHVLHAGEHIYVHSHRDFWSPRASGQAFFDTFLFGCQDLPPSPLDRVVNEGVRLEFGESVLIEEYPDRIATAEGQDFALIRCQESN
jgi:hypothetical protein